MNPMRRQILHYVLLPEILPRCRDIFKNGFGFIAYSMACVFQGTGLLHRQDPYCNPVNIGKFGVLNVFGRAAANIRFSKSNIDQLVVFGLMVLGCVLALIQLCVAGFSIFTRMAGATPLPTTFAGFFVSPDPENDISYMILDRIFGIPGFFDSCVALQTSCIRDGAPSSAFPAAYHTPLHDMLAFYSYGLIIVATIMLLYHVVTLVAEMAQTGTFFGRRFNKIWAPLRMVAAIGLLIPMTHNLNAAQYIALYVTKFGSAFATNAWNFYVADVTTPSTLAGPPETLVALPQPASANNLIQFMAMAQTCSLAYNKLYNSGPNAIDIKAYAVRTNTAPQSIRLIDLINGYPSLYAMQEWSDFGDITVVFGQAGTGSKFDLYKGNVIPYCGEITVPTTRIKENTIGFFSDGIDAAGYLYIYMIAYAWYDTASTTSLALIAQAIINHTLDNNDDPFIFTSQYAPPITYSYAQVPDDARDLVTHYNDVMRNTRDTSYALMLDPSVVTTWAETATKYGWAGASIWYNKIAEVNGAFSDAVASAPIVTKYPMISEMIQKSRLAASATIAGENRFDPSLKKNEGGPEFPWQNPRDRDISIALNSTYVAFLNTQDMVIAPETGNTITDAINALFKKSGLWSLRENENIHPLAGLASLGKTLVTNSIVTFGAGATAGVVGFLGKKSMIGPYANAASSLVVSIAYIGLAAGIMLYYIVPLMPFIYFLFAVAAWGKTIFEALLGIPLWALAHMRYDGEGFPPSQALYGYFLLVDLFIRPILIVFGLIASITIFYALNKTFNNIFNLVTSNLSGFDPAPTGGAPAANGMGSDTFRRGPIDELAFTLIYAVVCYLMGLSCFKMIDVFPNNILRWMGTGAKGAGGLFSEDSGEQLAESVQGGTHRIAGSIQTASGEIGTQLYGGR